MSKVYEKFGSQLACISSGKLKPISFMKPSYKITLEFKPNSTPIIKALFGSFSLSSLDDLVCSRCGSDYRVEMHHVRLMKDLNPRLSVLDQLMVKRNRKQIALCRMCHMNHHRGIKGN